MKKLIIASIIICTYLNMYSQKTDTQLKSDVQTVFQTGSKIKAADARDFYDDVIDSKVNVTVYDANSILKADADDTPIVLSIPAQTILGRSVGGSIAALDTNAIRALIFGDPTLRNDYCVRSNGTNWVVEDSVFVFGRNNDVGQHSIEFGTSLISVGASNTDNNDNLYLAALDTVKIGFDGFTKSTDIYSQLRILGDSSLLFGYDETSKISNTSHRSTDVLQFEAVDAYHFKQIDTSQTIIYIGDSTKYINFHDELIDDQLVTNISNVLSIGFGWVMVGDNEEFSQFRFGTTDIDLINNTSNIIDSNTDNYFCLYIFNNALYIRNRLGSSKMVTISIEYVN